MEISNVLDYNSTMAHISKVDIEKAIGVKQIDFTDFCKSVRKEAGLTQVEMAEQVGLSPTGYGDLERGRSEPSARTFLHLLAIRARSRGVNLKAFFAKE